MSEIEQARIAVQESDPKNIPHFAYYGDTLYGITYANMLAVHRDSDSLGRSNWSVISDYMLENYPDDCHIERSGHFLVGWADKLAIHVFTDDMCPVCGDHDNVEYHSHFRYHIFECQNCNVSWSVENYQEQTTLAYVSMLDWREKLSQYPVASDEHFSDLEHNEYYDLMIREIDRAVAGEFWYIEYTPDSDDILTEYESQFTYIEYGDHWPEYDDLKSAILAVINKDGRQNVDHDNPYAEYYTCKKCLRYTAETLGKIYYNEFICRDCRDTTVNSSQLALL